MIEQMGEMIELRGEMIEQKGEMIEQWRNDRAKVRQRGGDMIDLMGEMIEQRRVMITSEMIEQRNDCVKNCKILSWPPNYQNYNHCP